jgi:hypothetical protein
VLPDLRLRAFFGGGGTASGTVPPGLRATSVLTPTEAPFRLVTPRVVPT